MKTTLKVFLLSPLILTLCTLFAPSAVAIWPDNILITDITGQKERLSDASFDYSDTHLYNQHWHYFEIILTGSPRKSVWVHHSLIKVANFQKVEGGIRISVVLDNGEVLSGMFPDRWMKLQGKGDTGELTYKIADIRSIEFLQFELFKDKKRKIVDRQAAASIWKKEREKSRTWTIIDGNTTIYAQSFIIRDSYDTNKAEATIVFGESFRDQRFFSSITVQSEASQVNISLDDLETIEITGRKIDDKLEVTIVKKDGKKFSAALLMQKWEGRTMGRYEHDYGVVDEDDMLIWDKPYGYEGISLLPIRKITLKAHK